MDKFGRYSPAVGLTKFGTLGTSLTDGTFDLDVQSVTVEDLSPNALVATDSRKRLKTTAMGGFVTNPMTAPLDTAGFPIDSSTGTLSLATGAETSIILGNPAAVVTVPNLASNQFVVTDASHNLTTTSEGGYVHNPMIADLNTGGFSFVSPNGVNQVRVGNINTNIIDAGVPIVSVGGAAVQLQSGNGTFQLGISNGGASLAVQGISSVPILSTSTTDMFIQDPTGVASIHCGPDINALTGITGMIGANVQLIVDSSLTAMADSTMANVVLCQASPPVSGCQSDGIAGLFGYVNPNTALAVGDVMDLIAGVVDNVGRFAATSTMSFLDTPTVAMGPTSCTSLVLGNATNSTVITTPSLAASSVVGTDGSSQLTALPFTPPTSFPPVVDGTISGGIPIPSYTIQEGRYETWNGSVTYNFHVEGTISAGAAGDLILSVPAAAFAGMTIAGFGKAYIVLNSAPVATEAAFILATASNMFFIGTGGVVAIVPGNFIVQGTLTYFIA